MNDPTPPDEPSPTPMRRQITCRESTLLVSDLRDGVLSDADLASLESHIAQCEACRHARAEFVRLFAGLDELLAVPQAARGQELS